MAESKQEPLFNAGAAVYDSFVFLHAPAERTAIHASIHPGDTVLDVACGSGRTSIAAARMAGPDGSVTGIDIADKLLDVAKEKTAVSGLENVTYAIGDAEDIPFSSDRFDTVTCASSLFLFGDRQAALRECCRVLKPGGNCVFSVFGAGVFQPLSDIIEQRLKAYPENNYPEPLISVTDSVTKCCDLLASTGIKDYRIITEDLDLVFNDTEECWRQTARSLILRPRLSLLAKDQYAALKEDVLQELKTVTGSDSIRLQVPVLFLMIGT